MTSPTIGPAKQWYSLSRNVQALDVADEFEIEVIGIASDNSENTLYQGKENNLDLGFVDPYSYPKIKLRLVTRDPINLTPVEWKNWLVRYEPVAEGILLSRNGANATGKFEGEVWDGKYSFINPTQYDFPFDGNGETMDVKVELYNHDKDDFDVRTLLIAAPGINDSTVFEIPISTIGLGGMNNVSVTVNTEELREQHFFNNVLPMENYLSVIRDQQSPVLDVTVDGRYLVNGDVVSPNPRINMLLIDENPYWYKTDTLGVIILIKNLETDVVKRINFSDGETTWTPATATSDFNIVFTTQLEPGEYELSISVTDASGNLAGAEPYSVSFFVTDVSGFTIGSPFPNPAHDMISFPVRVSGSELPTDLSLKIISPVGRLIGNFTLDDVSRLYIGTNFIKLKFSELEGGSLPTGVYFYKLKMSSGDKTNSASGQIIYIRD
jgi:hypothetical protein